MKCILLVLLFLLVSCGPFTGNTARTLTVFAATSLTDAFTEIGHAFEAAQPGVNVRFNFAGSQSLRTQLEQGAIADVFASANHKEMDTLIGEHIVASGAPQDFLSNKLIIVLPATNPADVQSPADMAIPGIKVVLADKFVPAGIYARQMLENLNAVYGSDFKERVLANVVSNENDVRQVLTKVQLGEADLGVVYMSDSVAAPGLSTITIPEAYNVTANYPIAVINAAPRPDLAAEFINYVLSPAGQAILKKWGFLPVNP